MAKSLRKHIEQLFAAEMTTRGGFLRYEETSPYISRYDVVLTRKVRADNSALFVVLLFDHHGNSRISVEVGWASDQRFPRLPIRPSGVASAGRNEFKEPNFLARLSTLWGESDSWWEIKSKADIPEIVGDVISRLEAFGFPYLAEKELEQKIGGD